MLIAVHILGQIFVGNKLLIKKEALKLLISSYLIPSALAAAVATEWRVTAQEDVHDDAEAPEVAPLVVDKVAFGVIHEGLDDLRRHEFSRSNLGKSYFSFKNID